MPATKNRSSCCSTSKPISCTKTTFSKINNYWQPPKTDMETGSTEDFQQKHGRRMYFCGFLQQPTKLYSHNLTLQYNFQEHNRARPSTYKRMDSKLAGSQVRSKLEHVEADFKVRTYSPKKSCGSCILHTQHTMIDGPENSCRNEPGPG